jgi:O-antigen ligase
MIVLVRRIRQETVQFALCFLGGTLMGALMLLDLPPKWEIAFFGTIGIIVLMFFTKSPERVLLCILAFIVPFYMGKGIVERPGYTGYLLGISINLSDVFVLILFLLLLAKKALNQVNIHIPSIILAALAWLVLSSLSFLAAEDSQAAAFQLVNMGKMFLLCLAIAGSVRNDIDLTFVIAGLMLNMVFQSLVGIYQGVTGHPLGLGILAEATDLSKQELSIGLASRVMGTLGSPTALGFYLSTGVPFALALLFSRIRRYVKVLAAITLCLIGWALILSLTRAAWGNFLVAICLVLVLAVRRNRISKKGAIVIAGATALVLLGTTLFSTNLIRSRLTSSDQGSAHGRITQAIGALAIIQDNPVVGIGLNNYALVSPRYDQADAAAWNRYAPIVHNSFLLIAAETGLLGLGAFIVFLVILLVQAWRIIDNAPSDTVWVTGVGILAGLAAMIIHSMVDYTLLGSARVFNQFWLLAGLCAALMQRVDHERHDIRRALYSSNTMTRGLRFSERDIHSK